jgi:hypothetical protein
MIRTLLAKAVVVAQRVIRALFAEAVVGSLRAKSMVWAALAQPRQANQPQTEPMSRMPATETTPMHRPQQGFGAVPAGPDERRAESDGRDRGHGDPCGRRRPSECSEQDAVQQYAAYRAQSGHGSP